MVLHLPVVKAAVLAAKVGLLVAELLKVVDCVEALAIEAIRVKKWATALGSKFKALLLLDALGALLPLVSLET